jgi:hypothetical protein
MLNDIATNVKAQLYDRVSSPLLGSFIVSWCLWNWKVILILVSSLSATEKITYIELNFFPTWKAYATQGLAIPLLITLAIIYIYPIPARAIYRKTRGDLRELKEIQQAIEDVTPMPLEEARKRRQLLRNIETLHDEELASKEAENLTLQTQRANLSSELQQLREQFKAREEQLTDLQRHTDSLSSAAAHYDNTAQRLAAMLAACSQQIFIEPGTGTVYLSNRTNTNNAIPPSSENAATGGPEYTLERHIHEQGLFLYKGAAIRIIADTVYLYTALPEPKIFLLGKFVDLDYSQSINQMKNVLRQLDEQLKQPDSAFGTSIGTRLG